MGDWTKEEDSRAGEGESSMNYKVIGISKTVADRVRATMVSPHGGLPAFSSVADGYGPCRNCLKTFRQGEEDRIYISYDPFAGVSDLPLPGPVRQ